MSKRKAAALSAVLGLVLLAVASTLVWLERQSRQTMDPVGDRAGVDELQQIFGESAPDAGSGEDAEGDAGEAALRDSIRGMVVRANDESVAGARIVVTAAGTEERQETVTDAGGQFDVGPLPSVLFVVEAVAEGFGPAIAVGVLPGGSSLRLVLPEGLRLDGVVMRGGAPVPHAAVHLGGAGVFPQRTELSDASGRFRFAGLRAGAYEIVATATGLGSGFGGRVTVDRAPEADSEVVDVVPAELHLYESPEVTLRVRDGITGDPVVGSVVTLSERELHVLNLSEVAEAGELAVDYLPRGRYAMRIRAPGYLPWEGDLDVGGAPAEVDVRLSRGATIRGRVEDLAGNGIEGASLGVVVQGEPGGRWELRRTEFDDFHRLVRPDGTYFWPSPVGFRSGPDGAFALSGLPGGTGQVVASRDGMGSEVSGPLVLQPDATYEPVVLRLGPGRRVRGRVEDGTGGGIGGAIVSARDPSLPEWASGGSVVTDGVGGFLLEGLGRRARLEVRHPEFGPAIREVEIPEEGLDDLIIRLSGEQVAVFTGRLFTPRGRPAVGALVWVMHGRNELPVCRAVVGADGWFYATHCTAAPETMIASFPGYAPLVAPLSGAQEPRDWTFTTGGEIEVVSGRTAVVATVAPAWVLPAVLWARPVVDIDRWSRYRVLHVAPGEYVVTCEAEGFRPATVELRVDEGARAEVVCPFLARRIDFPIYVVDREGAPVRDALVLVDGLDEPMREFTDENGMVRVSSDPGVWLSAEAMHEAWGRGSLDLYVPWQTPSDPFRVELTHGIAGADPGAFLADLNAWGIHGVPMGRGVVVESVEPDSPAQGVGIRREDPLLWARSIGEFRFSVGVRRAGSVLTFDLLREPERQD